MSGSTQPQPAAAARSVDLDPITFESLLTLESPDEPGTPIGSELKSLSEDLAVRGECSGTGTLTVSLNSRAWLRVSCATGRVSSAERLLTSFDLRESARPAGRGPFVVAQSGNSSAGTHWRVTVRRIGAHLAGGRSVV